MEQTKDFTMREYLHTLQGLQEELIFDKKMWSSISISYHKDWICIFFTIIWGTEFNSQDFRLYQFKSESENDIVLQNIKTFIDTKKIELAA